MSGFPQLRNLLAGLFWPFTDGAVALPVPAN